MKATEFNNVLSIVVIRCEQKNPLNCDPRQLIQQFLFLVKIMT